MYLFTSELVAPSSNLSPESTNQIAFKRSTHQGRRAQNHIFSLRSILLGAVALSAVGACNSTTSSNRYQIDPDKEFVNTVVNEKAISQVMGVNTIHKKGTTGKGILVGIVDTGIATDIPGLAHRISESSIHISTMSDDIKDRAGHGTKMASIIASVGSAGGLVGMAPGAELLVVRADDEDRIGIPSVTTVTKGIKYAAEKKADIINLSLYSNDIRIVNEIQNAANKGSIVVVATGNTGKYNDPSRISYEVGNYGDRVLAVTALGIGNRIASFAAPCDVADPRYCVAAPGSRVQSIDHNGLEGPTSGTSAATAVVSGGIALMRQHFPKLNPEDIVDILLETAKDIGDKGVDRVYGSGMVDFEAAMRPVGTVSVAGLDGMTGLSASSAEIGAAFGDGLGQAALIRSLHIKDSYDRDYQIDIQSNLSARQAAFEDIDLLQDMRISALQTDFGPLSLSYSSVTDSLLTNIVEDDWFFAMNIASGENSSLHFSTSNTSRNMGASDYNFYSVQSDPMRSPFSLMADRYTSIGYQNTSQIGHFKTRVELAETGDFGDNSTLVSLGYETHSLNGIRANLSLSALNEPGSILDTQFSGAYGEISTGRSFAATIGAAYQADGFDLFVSGSLGKSSVDMKQQGLITGFKDITFSQWNFGFGFASVFTGNDRLALGFGQPVRIEDGKAQFYDNSEHALRPSGRELNAELTYRATVNETSFATSVLYGHNVSNLDAEKGQFKAAFLISRPF